MNEIKTCKTDYEWRWCNGANRETEWTLKGINEETTCIWGGRNSEFVVKEFLLRGKLFAATLAITLQTWICIFISFRSPIPNLTSHSSIPAKQNANHDCSFLKPKERKEKIALLFWTSELDFYFLWLCGRNGQSITQLATGNFPQLWGYSSSPWPASCRVPSSYQWQWHSWITVLRTIRLHLRKKARR